MGFLIKVLKKNAKVSIRGYKVFKVNIVDSISISKNPRDLFYKFFTQNSMKREKVSGGL